MAIQGPIPVEFARVFAHGVFAAGEFELLAAVTDSLRRSSGSSRPGRLGISVLVGEGLVALAAGNVDEAVSLLLAATARLDELGYAFDSACLRLDLGLALERAGDAHAAAAKRREAASVLSALGCVNPF